jgi:hypothetical protein
MADDTLVTYPPVNEPKDLTPAEIFKQAAEIAREAASVSRSAKESWDLIPILLIGGLGIGTIIWYFDYSKRQRRRRRR